MTITITITPDDNSELYSEIIQAAGAHLAAQVREQVFRFVQNHLTAMMADEGPESLRVIAEQAIRDWATKVGPSGQSPKEFLEHRLQNHMAQVISGNDITRLRKLARIMELHTAPDLAKALVDEILARMRTISDKRRLLESGR